jgi:low temperature requirement protein LtrA
MRPRDPHDPHRAATPLELLFDLVSVIAIAAAAEGLHHAIAEAHPLEGIVGYAMAFFAIWWAWMNYTWFASAYDNDSVAFRLLTMVIMAGSLFMAAGIRQFFGTPDFTLPVAGYVIMRLGMVSLWLLAAHGDPGCRRTCLTYAGGIALVQGYWVLFLLIQPLPHVLILALFLLGVVLELAVPVLAERHGHTTWHHHHIVERYGLLNIIVLGETLLAGSLALGQAEWHEPGLLRLVLASLVILFAMWWLYFARGDHLSSEDLGRAFTWGYGHLPIYAAGAAVGAGFAVMVDVATHHAEIGPLAGHLSVAVPVALYMAGLWFVRDRFTLVGPARSALPVAALMVVVAAFLPFAMEAVAAICVAAVIVRRMLAGRARETGHAA